MKGPSEGSPLSLGQGGKWTVYMKPISGGGVILHISDLKQNL